MHPYLLALLGATPALAHMTLASPKPFGNPTTSPLSSDGSNFPCQITGDAATFYSSTASANNTLAIGATQTLSFAGSAVHGGGSCQLALTSDLQPSSSTAWQVILSIEGGCPTTDGSGPSTYDYTIPDSIAPGDYVFAWTWISKLSGAPEYYMNCAPVTVTGGATKRDQGSDLTKRDSSALPNLFVANLASINDCKTTTSTDPLYPDPGPNVLKPSKMTTNFQAVSGTDCFPIGGTDITSGNATASTNSTTGNSGSGNSTDPDTSTTAAAATSATPLTILPVTTSNSTAAATSAAPATTETATSAAPATTTAAGTTTAATSAAPATTSAASSSGGGSGLSGACTDEGTFNCVGGTEYQQCASGSWTALQAMPAGTTCKEGESTTLWSRDYVDFNATVTTTDGGDTNTTDTTTDTTPAYDGSQNVTAPANDGSQNVTDTTTTTTTTATGLSGTCSPEGLFNCVGGSLYQQCAVGLWSTLQAMPAGTACQEGQSTTLWARRRRDVAASSAAPATAVAAASSAPATTVAAISAAPATTVAVVASSAPATTAAAISAAPTTTAAATASGAPTSAGLSGGCATEGLFNCVGGTQYQQCAAGTWSALQAVPAGTACQEGESTTLWARGARRSRFHARRRRVSRE